MSVSPSGQVSGKQGSRTLISRWENRLSRAARPTVSGYFPFTSGPTGNRTRISSLPNWCRPVDHEPVSTSGDDGNRTHPGCLRSTLAGLGTFVPVSSSSRGGNRTHKHFTSLSNWPLYRFCVLGHVAKKGTGTFCAKHPSGRSGKMCPSPFLPSIRVTKGRIELPIPCGPGLLRTVRIPVPPLGHASNAKGDGHDLPERPFGCFAQIVPIPFCVA
jgi:hypothetical protein